MKLGQNLTVGNKQQNASLNSKGINRPISATIKAVNNQQTRS